MMEADDVRCMEYKARYKAKRDELEDDLDDDNSSEVYDIDERL